jgi:hypothetical protein
MVASVRFHPALIVAGPFAQQFLAHHRFAQHLPEEVHHLLRPRQPAQVPVDHDPVEAVVYKDQQAAKQLCERFHRSPPLDQSSQTDLPTAADGNQISNIFG